MKLLLDTHIWLWSLLEPDKLDPRVSSALLSSKNELWLSPITIWEAMILIEKSRVIVEGRSSHEWIDDATRQVPFNEATLTREVAVQSRLLELPNQDPADRFLVASAKVYGLTLVTGDERLLGTTEISVLSNL